MSLCDRYCPVCSTKFSKINCRVDDSDRQLHPISPRETDANKMEKLIIKITQNNNNNANEFHVHEFPYNKIPKQSYSNNIGERYSEVLTSLKMELLATGVISDDIFAKQLLFCKNRLIEIKHKYLYTFNTNNDHYDIRFGKSIGIENVLALKMYCDFKQLADIFRKSYSNQSEHTKFYWFARFLFAACEFCGKQLGQNKKVYMVTNQKVLFREFSTNKIFQKPIFLTRNYARAQKCLMKNKNSMIITFMENIQNETRCIEYNKLLYNETNCDMLLFFGYTNNLIINNIELWSENKKGCIDFQFEMKCLNYWSSISDVYNDRYDSYHKDVSVLQDYIAHLISIEVDKYTQQTDDIIDEEKLFVLELFNHYRIHKKGIIFVDKLNKQLKDNNVSFSLKKCLKRINNTNDKVTINISKMQQIYPNCSFALFKQ